MLGTQRCNVEAEMMVLGAMMLEDESIDVIPRVKSVLGRGASVFYKESHGVIYEAIVSLYEADLPVNLVSVTGKLQARGRLEAAGGVSYLDSMIDSVATTKQVEWYANEVKQCAELRAATRMLTVLLQDMQTPGFELDEMHPRLQSVIDEMYDTGFATVYSIPKATEAYREYIKDLQKRKITFGWPEIDKGTRGMIMGDVCMIVARSSVGKSALAQSLQLDVWKRHHIKSVFFSLEMPISAVFERAASMVSGWDEQAVEELFTDGEEGDVVKKLREYEDGIYYVDKPGLSLDEIRAISSTIPDLGMIIIDYLGLVEAPGKISYEQSSYVAKKLKTLAKQTDTAVVCLSQTSRKGEDGTVPVTFDMARDTGVVEEATDIMIGMHRDAEDDKVIHVCLLKGRRGRRGAETQMMFFSETPRIVPMAKNTAYISE